MNKLDSMKFLTTSIVVLLAFHFNGVKSVKSEDGIYELFVPAHPASAITSTGTPHTTQNGERSTPPYRSIPYSIYSFPSTTRATTSTPSTTTTEPNPLDNISIQDLLLSGIDANEKIQKKIINEIQNFQTHFHNYRKPITLKIEDYVFPKKLIKYDLDKGYLTFYNISLSHWYNSGREMYSEFSYSVKCDSSKAAKMNVGLPTNIQISANFSLTTPLIESANKGGITIVIKNGTILKHDVTSTNFSDQFSKISYSNSKIDIQFDAGPQTVIYSKLEAFFNEIESSLRQFFAQQFDQQMEERSLSLSSDCSNFRYADLSTKKINSPYFNNFLNNLYVIPDTKIETWNGITLSTGPIVMEGFALNSAELHVSKERDPYDMYHYYVEKLTSRTRTALLKGKFEWNYILDGNTENNSSFDLSFSIDDILFENSYMNSNRRGSEQKVNVYLGKIKIEPSILNSENKEIKFARIVLREYLRSAITKYLEKSFTDKTDSTQFLSSARTFFDTKYYN